MFCCEKGFSSVDLKCKLNGTKDPKTQIDQKHNDRMVQIVFQVADFWASSTI